jgi:ABC-type phosphate/phosphonate transport system substrate-binding protein
LGTDAGTQVTLELIETPVRPDLKGAFASLPWYDFPEVQAANDALWHAIAAGLRARGLSDVPATLDRTLPYGVDWNRACLLTQTCGYPIFTTSRGHFSVVAAPCYGARGCEGPQHRSFIVVRRRSRFRTLDDLRGTIFAINEADSNSGMNLPRRLFAPFNRDGRFFERTIVSGSHAASAEFVVSVRADAAAIDCVTFALLQRHRAGVIEDLRIVAETPASPTPPLATSNRRSPAEVAALRSALQDVVHDAANADILDVLLLRDISIADQSSYQIVMTYEREAAALGYPVLA